MTKQNKILLPFLKDRLFSIFTHIKKNALNHYSKFIVFCNFQQLLANSNLIKLIKFFKVCNFLIEYIKYTPSVPKRSMF